MWENGEVGPPCSCGSPTVVLNENGKQMLVCVMHTKEGGAYFVLPKRKPRNWPKLTEKEVVALIEEGKKEHELDGKSSECTWANTQNEKI